MKPHVQDWAAYAERLGAAERAIWRSWASGAWGEPLLVWPDFRDPVYGASGERARSLGRCRVTR
jgi:hypothetical protein